VTEIFLFFFDCSIGFDTVVQGAVDAIHRTLLAASSVQGGIGIIKLVRVRG